MKKLMVSVSVLVLLVANVFGATNRIQQAAEFMNAGMYPQAIALLEVEINGDEIKRIKANPTNAEAHFQLGICYVNQSLFNDAEERFASAVQLNPGQYAYRISQIYSQVGQKQLATGDMTTAQELYNKAVEYNPGLRKIIAHQVFMQGKNYLQYSQFQQAENSFKIASQLDNCLSQNITTLYYTSANTTALSVSNSSVDTNNTVIQIQQEDQNLYYYNCLSQHTGLYDKEIGQRLLNIAKNLSRINMKEKTEQYKNEAIKYVGAKTVEEAFPWWDHEIILGKDQVIELGTFEDGDILRTWSSHGFIRHEEGSVP
ncbi:hypothetical protein KJ992_00355, partial [Patescibacteria group bacterium]|nr:hypothetical protein [Patescibacteria group bacterium]